MEEENFCKDADKFLRENERKILAENFESQGLVGVEFVMLLGFNHL